MNPQPLWSYNLCPHRKHFYQLSNVLLLDFTLFLLETVPILTQHPAHSISFTFWRKKEARDNLLVNWNILLFYLNMRKIKQASSVTLLIITIGNIASEKGTMHHLEGNCCQNLLFRARLAYQQSFGICLYVLSTALGLQFYATMLQLVPL